METPKQLQSVETDEYSLEIIQCSCGFHLGIDATYLEQIGDFIILCPCCSKFLNTKHILMC